MSKPWFNCQERIRALRLEAESWRETPFRPNSNTPGPRGGVSCQKLVSEIYRRCGWRDIPVPDVPMAHGRFVKDSLVVAFMDQRQEFEAVDLAGDRLERIQPGDMLGLRIGQCVHHCAIYLGEKKMVHAIEHIGVQYPLVTDPIWWSRWAVAWRPLEEPKWAEGGVMPTERAVFSCALTSTPLLNSVFKRLSDHEGPNTQ